MSRLLVGKQKGVFTGVEGVYLKLRVGIKSSNYIRSMTIASSIMCNSRADFLSLGNNWWITVITLVIRRKTPHTSIFEV